MWVLISDNLGPGSTALGSDFVNNRGRVLGRSLPLSVLILLSIVGECSRLVPDLIVLRPIGTYHRFAF